MAGHVNNSKQEGWSSRRGGGEFQVCEAEVDGDPSRFLIRQAVGIRTGQCFDQRTLSVIHVTSSRDDVMLWLSHRKPVSTAAIRGEFRLSCVISRRGAPRQFQRPDLRTRFAGRVYAGGSEEFGGEGRNRTCPPARSVGATVLKTATTTRHASLSG